MMHQIGLLDINTLSHQHEGNVTVINQKRKSIHHSSQAFNHLHLKFYLFILNDLPDPSSSPRLCQEPGRRTHYSLPPCSAETQTSDGMPEEAHFIAQNPRLQCAQKDSLLQIRIHKEMSSQMMVNWQGSAFILYMYPCLVPVLFGIFFTFSLALRSALRVDPNTAAVPGDSFTERAHPNHTCCEWKEQGQPLVTCPLHQHLLTSVHSLFRHFIICPNGGEVGWAQKSKINWISVFLFCQHIEAHQ